MCPSGCCCCIHAGTIQLLDKSVSVCSTYNLAQVKGKLTWQLRWIKSSFFVIVEIRLWYAFIQTLLSFNLSMWGLLRLAPISSFSTTVAILQISVIVWCFTKWCFAVTLFQVTTKFLSSILCKFDTTACFTLSLDINYLTTVNFLLEVFIRL